MSEGRKIAFINCGDGTGYFFNQTRTATKTRPNAWQVNSPSELSAQPAMCPEPLKSTTQRAMATRSGAPRRPWPWLVLAGVVALFAGLATYWL